MSDKFTELATLYYDYMKTQFTYFASRSEICTVSYLPPEVKKSFFGSKPEKEFKHFHKGHLKPGEALKHSILHQHSNHVGLVLSSEDFGLWLENIKEFGAFIRNMEKCFMYDNSEISPIHAEENTKENKITVYFLFENHKVKFSFEPSKIPNLEHNPLLDDEEYADIVNISIIREYGKAMCNEFKFVNIKSEDIVKSFEKSDKILIEVIQQETIRLMNETLDNIMNSIIPVYKRINTINWKEAIEDGLRVR